MKDQEKKANKPVEKFSVGGITTSIWLNEGTSSDNKKFSFFSVTLQKSYKVKDEWKNDQLNVKLSDIPKMQLALAKSYEFIAMKKKDTDEED